jgi:hypothetical protein
MPPNRMTRKRIGFGKTKTRPIIAAKPTNHIHGAIAAIARPPSSGRTGTRLKRFRKKPVKASARRKSLSVASATGISAAVPSVPRTGPASPMRASASALPPSERAPTAAPRKGMNSMKLGLTPSRRIWMKWPISCTNKRATNPTANFQPQISA